MKPGVASGVAVMFFWGLLPAHAECYLKNSY